MLLSKRAPMLTAYVKAALRRAHLEQLLEEWTLLRVSCSLSLPAQMKPGHLEGAQHPLSS